MATNGATNGHPTATEQAANLHSIVTNQQPIGQPTAMALSPTGSPLGNQRPWNCHQPAAQWAANGHGRITNWAQNGQPMAAH